MSIYINNAGFLNEILGSDYSKNSPILAYRSVLTVDDISVPGTSSSRPPSNMWSPDTSTTWEGEGYSGASSTLTQYILLENPGRHPVDYIGIARHNLGSEVFSYKMQSSADNITWVDLTPFKTSNDDSPILDYFDVTTVTAYFRIVIEKTGLKINPPIIAHVKMGRVLILQRRIYVGHSPSMVKNVKKQNYGSENGQYLGAVVLRAYRSSEIQQENNSPDYVRLNVVPFINHVNGINSEAVEGSAQETFFFSWSPTKYEDDIVYGWTKDNIQPNNQGGDSMGGRMSWGLSVEATA